MKAKGRRGKGASREARRKPAPRKVERASQPFEFLEHPADVGFLARGKTVEELFAAAALAMCDYGWELDRVRPREKIEIRARAATLEDLIYSWLAELLFLSDAERWVFKKFVVSSIEQRASGDAKLWEIEGTAHGERFEKKRHRPRTYIKAVTYHQLTVKQAPAGWSATVYLDV